MKSQAERHLYWKLINQEGLSPEEATKRINERKEWVKRVHKATKEKEKEAKGTEKTFKEAFRALRMG